MENLSKKTYDEVNKNLGLIEDADWGIINEDADRVKEFIEYYNKNADLLEPFKIYEFIELVISSFNAALVEEKVDNELKFLFKEFIYPHLADEDDSPLSRYEAVSYWACFDPEVARRDFPVAFMIKEMMGE